MSGYNQTGYPKLGLTSVTSYVAAGAGTTVFMDEAVISSGPNFVEGAGAANALTATMTDIVAGTSIHPRVGTMVLVKTGYALQIGANTFNLNSHGTDSIVSAHNYATNLDTIIAAGAMLLLAFDGTRWQAVGY